MADVSLAIIDNLHVAGVSPPLLSNFAEDKMSRSGEPESQIWEGIAMKFSCLVGLTFVASAFLSAANAEEITASGCVAEGIEEGCLILSSGGKNYDITLAKPSPKIGAYGTVSGTVFSGVTRCMQGTGFRLPLGKKTTRKSARLTNKKFTTVPSGVTAEGARAEVLWQRCERIARELRVETARQNSG